MYNIDVVSSFGPLCLLISSLVSNEIINYFSIFKLDDLIGKTTMFDMNTYKSSIIKWEKNVNCKECANNES